MNGGVKKENLSLANVAAVEEGCCNLGRHIENVKQFGVPSVVAINHFVSDTPEEVEVIRKYAKNFGVEAIICRHWAQGSAGAEDLAHAVVKLVESGVAQFSPLYANNESLFSKISTVAKRIYRASEVIADQSVREQLRVWEEQGYGDLPVCMAKTPYSFSTDPNLKGSPDGHVVAVREVRISAGAGFIVVICGDIMTMPGLPSRPSAESIFLNENSYVEGLF
jgi:formate--tetrahydrofolate ligase